MFLGTPTAVMYPKLHDRIGFSRLSRTSRSPPLMTQEEFRRVCSRFATGVAVLTVADASGSPHGLTVNSFTSVSAVPPLVLVCVDNDCSLLPIFHAASHFGLSFLAEHQQDISARFAFVPERRFDGVDWSSGLNGVPLVNGALGWLECRIQQQIPAGDHVILLGEVLNGDSRPDGDPLVYFGSGYRRLLP